MRRGRPPRSGSRARPRERASTLDVLEHLSAALPPWIELVRAMPIAPRIHRRLLLPIEPERAAELEVRLDEIRTDLQRLLEEGLRILVHLALEIHETEVEVRVQGRFPVVVE